MCAKLHVFTLYHNTHTTCVGHAVVAVLQVIYTPVKIQLFHIWATPVNRDIGLDQVRYILYMYITLLVQNSSQIHEGQDVWLYIQRGVTLEN